MSNFNSTLVEMVYKLILVDFSIIVSHFFFLKSQFSSNTTLYILH